EFGSLSRVVPLGDGRLLAWDGGGGGRIVLFGLGGEHLSTHRVENVDLGEPVLMSGQVVGGAWTSPTFVGALLDGSVILRQRQPSLVRQFELPDGPHPDSVRFLHYSPDTRAAVVLAAARGDERTKESLGTASTYRLKMFEREVVAEVTAGG